MNLKEARLVKRDILRHIDNQTPGRDHFLDKLTLIAHMISLSVVVNYFQLNKISTKYF